MMLSNCHEAKYAKVNRSMKDGSKEEFEYNRILQQNHGRCRPCRPNGKCLWIRSKILQVVKKSIFSPIDERSGQLMDCVLRTQTSENEIFLISLYLLQKP
ncbi:hypothetical protein TNCT_158261 [Trichonephila clavata]|uniref:Uncharacterized protein n=1 Tax=Trichonephila clavata TaxID=2740835 RepID=A0A8X6KI14_TRICU|nr:hypothetical protein TNCT_158261 [Trichonephila clavata]